MKILLLSDTHGDLTKPFQIWGKLNNIDLILHCGDYQSDAEFLEEQWGVSVISVLGNSDNESFVEDRKVVETPYGNILLTHGHREFVNFERWDKLLYLAEENNCIAVCFGHTHRAFCENFDGIRLINPGSLSEPRDGSDGTYAIIESTEDDFSVNIIHYKKSDFTDSENRTAASKKPEQKPKSKGGFLRKLLNYSDRF